MEKKKKKRPWAVLFTIALAIVVGTLVGKETAIFGIPLISIFDVIGKLFLNGLTLIVVPLVTSSIILGVARIGSDVQFGRIGLKTFGFYFLTKLLAVVIGVVLVNLIQPGSVVDIAKVSGSMDAEKLAMMQQQLNMGAGSAFVHLLYDLVPSNIVNAFAKGNMLGIILFSIVFGYAIIHTAEKHKETQLHFWNGVFEAMLKMTDYLMRLLIIGVFCLVAKVFAETGLESLRNVGLFFVTVILSLAIFCLGALPLLLRFVAKVPTWRLFRAMGPALITAFSTSSSSASLPITLECVEKRAGVSNRICSLVIPLGISINLTGSALYEGVAAIFIAQSYGIDLSFGMQFLFVFIALFTSIGIAGVPHGGLVIILMILKIMGLPLEGIGLILAVDRILDMFRTTANIFADGVCAVLVAKSEGEKNVLTKTSYD